MPYKLRRQWWRDRSTGARALMVRHRPRCSQRRERPHGAAEARRWVPQSDPWRRRLTPRWRQTAVYFLFSAIGSVRRRVAGDGQAPRCEDGWASGLAQLWRARRAAQHRRGQRRPSSGGRARGGRRSRTRGGGFLRYGVFTESRDGARLRVCKVVIILLIWAV